MLKKSGEQRSDVATERTRLIFNFVISGTVSTLTVRSNSGPIVMNGWSLVLGNGGPEKSYSGISSVDVRGTTCCIEDFVACAFVWELVNVDGVV